MLVVIIVLLILFCPIYVFWKAINTFPMQAELDRINSSKTFWEVIYNDRNYRDRCELAECINCALTYGGCPLNYINQSKVNNIKNLKYTAEYCPATVQQHLKSFQ